MFAGKKIVQYVSFIFTLAILSCSKHLYQQQASDKHYITQEETGVDSSVYKTILPYKQQLEGKINEVIGNAPVALVKKSPESNLGNFFADAVYIRTLGLQGIDTSKIIAVFNPGGLRTSVPQGNVTVGNMFELMPFENKLVLFPLSGKRILQLCNFIAEKDGAPLAGIRFVIHDKKAEKIYVHTMPLDTMQTYTVATSDYLAGGGDKFFTADETTNYTNTNILLRDILIDYCKNLTAQNKPVTSNTDGRISITK